MFDGLVLASVVALILSSAVLFSAGTRVRSGHWLLSLTLGAAVAAVSWWTSALVLGQPLPLAPTMAVSLVVVAAAAATFDEWTSIGHVAMSATVLASGSFLLYAASVMVTARLGWWSLGFGLLLILLQLAAHLLVWTHTFEALDVICRRAWKRRRLIPAVGSSYAPKVSLHVPTHNEPPELVRLTLDALAALEYSDFEVIVVDNNTEDEDVWRPVEEHCRRLGPRFRFYHVRPWPGYKSGALNFALARTAAAAEIVGVIDADYVVRPDFLKALVGYFADPRVAFVQTPQDYRDVETRGRYGRALYLAYRVFFDLSMPSRNERNAIIYAGTMGLLRRSALEQVGGWDEWCITEDAELSLRLLGAGHQSVFVERSFGHGLMPLDFAGLKKQRFRWAFGGMQILRLHAGRLLAPRRTGLTLSQRAAYVIGGLQWLNDPLTFAFTLLLLIGGGALVFGGSLHLQPLAGAAIFVPLLFVLVSVVRFLWAFRRAAGCSMTDAFNALTVLLALTWVVTLACVLGLFKKHGVFLRTPKVARDVSWTTSLRVVTAELVLGLLCAAAFVGVLVTGAARLPGAAGLMLLLLGWQTFIYFSAIRTSLWSWRAHPERQPVALQSDYHTTGPHGGPFVPEWRTAALVAVASALLALFYYIAVNSAPIMELVMRADPLRQHRLMGALIARPHVGAAGAVLIQEAHAVRRGDIETALRLWHPDGAIVDSNFTPADPADDRRWQGLPALRARYEAELAERRYRRLRHHNLSIEIKDDIAVMQNDLEATIETPHDTYEVRLPRSDRWILRYENGAWRLLRLELNRADGPPEHVARGRS